MTCHRSLPGSKRVPEMAPTQRSTNRGLSGASAARSAWPGQVGAEGNAASWVTMAWGAQTQTPPSWCKRVSL